MKNISSEIPFDIPNSWCWARIKDISLTQTGTTPSTLEKENFGSYIPFIKPGDILNEQINYDNEGLSETGIKKGRLIKKDSVLMVCIGGSTGKCAITDRDIACNQQINTATPLEEILPTFLFHYMISDFFIKKVRETATGTATPIINRGQWENLLMCIPPSCEQLRICNRTSKLLSVIKKGEY